MRLLEKKTVLDVEKRITHLSAVENQLVEEALSLPGAETEAQRTGDPIAVRKVLARGKELPKLIALAKADRFEALADLEAVKARASEDDASALERVGRLTAERERLDAEIQAQQGLIDSSRRRFTEHRAQETEYRSEAYRLRRNWR
jgi:hypothetical protein